jgi:enoyl-[acyl-carrier protein] reductase II
MPADTFKGIWQVYFDGDMEAAPALAGQSAGLIHDMLPVQRIVEDLVAGPHAIGARLGALAAQRGFGVARGVCTGAGATRECRHVVAGPW